MENIIKWYFNLDKFNKNEIEILKRPYTFIDSPYNVSNYFSLEDAYFDRMPFCNITSKTHQISFNESGTAFITDIFKEEVDEDTLVISTYYEHGSVQTILNNISNKLLLNYELDICQYNLDKILYEAKKYKKVFVYIIGTQLSTGEIIPQLFFEKLKQAFVKNNIIHKMMLDDVHGMFLVPRDYSLFDYILYTAHAIVKDFNMGMLISKKNTFEFGKKEYSWGNEYLKRLDIILKRKEKIFMFKHILLSYFNELFSVANVFSYYTQTVNHIFSIKTKNIYFTDKERLLLEKYNIQVSEHQNINNWIRIRYQDFISMSYEDIENGFNILENIIKRKLMILEMKGL